MRAKRDDYDKLFSTWTKAFANVKGLHRKKQIDSFWNENKHDVLLVQNKIKELERQHSKQTVSIKHFFTTSTYRRPSKQSTSETPDSPGNSHENEVVVVDEGTASTSSSAPQPASEKRSIAQESATKLIGSTNTKIVSLMAIKDIGLATTSQLNELKSLKKDAKKQAQRLKSLQEAAERQRRFRARMKEKLKVIQAKMPEEAECIPGTRAGPGRPRLEENQKGLLDAIIRIVTPNSSADIGRRSELIRSCSTLDDLHNQLKVEGYELSRTSTYLRLLPKNESTTEGRRHYQALPVKLIRARNDGRSAHQDSHFCAASVKFLKDLAEIMGPHATFVISQDDKARVPLGIPAATKESPILMHLDYRVTLPDHDFPLGSRHKLIPSVYAGLTFDGKGRTLTYAGPTYIAIRSGKHDKSCPGSHANDFRKLYGMPLFQSLARTSEGIAKPIVIIFTDGGPDENPRFEAVINEAIEHFRELDLDGLFIATHAPGQSAMNQVERRMAPLSRDLSGLILPHDYYGSHLDGTRTVDTALEIQNFQRAGEALAEIWSNTVINGNEVFAEYIQPSIAATKSCRNVSEQWYATHVRSSQYLLQIIKCADSDCCGNPRSCLGDLLNGFLPGPVPLLHSEKGLELCESQTDSCFYGSLALRLSMKLFESRICQVSPVPFDWSCPSIHDEINGRICNICNIYFCSKKAVVSHKKVVHTSSIASIMESIESVVQQRSEEESDEIPVISDMFDWLQSPFTDCTPADSN